MLEGLLAYDFDLRPKPQLATAWSVSPDGLKYTFTLRQNVKWHDGQPFTSADVAFSIDLLKSVHPRGRSTFANVTSIATPDARTARAVLAFRKVTGLARIETAGADVFRKLAHGAGAFKVRFPKQGHHVEANLKLQVLALINGSKVERIYPISSGKPSTPTVLGTFRVYSKTPGTNAKGMVYTSYFHGGYGIHGYAEVPTFAASHGCLRTPVPDAIPIFNWIKYGDYVDVYPG